MITRHYYECCRDRNILLHHSEISRRDLRHRAFASLIFIFDLGKDSQTNGVP